MRIDEILTDLADSFGSRCGSDEFGSWSTNGPMLVTLEGNGWAPPRQDLSRTIVEIVLECIVATGYVAVDLTTTVIASKDVECSHCDGSGSVGPCETCDGDGRCSCDDCGDEHDCRKCSGRGFLAGRGEKCRECEGAKKIRRYDPTDVTPTVRIEGRFLEYILDLPGAVSLHVRTETDAAWCRWGSGYAVVMPMKIR